jgi:hypothetical protein
MCVSFRCLLLGLLCPCAPRGPGDMSGGMHSDVCCWRCLSPKKVREGKRWVLSQGTLSSAPECGSVFEKRYAWWVALAASVGMCTAKTIVRCLLFWKNVWCRSVECDFSLCLQPRVVLLLRKMVRLVEWLVGGWMIQTRACHGNAHGRLPLRTRTSLYPSGAQQHPTNQRLRYS